MESNPSESWDFPLKSMEATRHRISTVVDVTLPAAQSFEIVLGELTDALARLGLRAEFQPSGKIMDGGIEVGTIALWKPGNAVHLRWHPADWETDLEVEILLAFEPTATGTRITWDLRGLDQVIGDPGAELAGWLGSSLLPALLNLLTPSQFGDWFVDRRARRPSGEQALETYRNPLYHWPNFLLILDRMRLRPNDRLLEVGCGGGAFLHRALESGCTATGVDYSPSMVRLARDVNRSAVEAGRLTVTEGDAAGLPVASGSFTVCVSTGVFNFFPDPTVALGEMYRALVPGGRLAIFTDTAAARGTPAAPEPFASRSRFYEPNEIAELARNAGFSEVQVEEPNLAPFAKAAHLPEDIAAVFEGTGGALLMIAKKPAPP